MFAPIYKNVAIVGLARDEAPLVISSGEIEERLAPMMNRLKLPQGLLASLTGISGRRLYPLRYKPSQAAANAANRLFDSIAFDKNKIDLLYSTSVCRDHIEPSTASIIQARLGLGGKVKSLDIGSACLGFIDGMELAALAIESGRAGHALIVAGENSAPVLEATLETLSGANQNRNDFFCNFATLTLGSGGAAMILGRAEEYPLAPRLVCSVSRSDTSANHLCRGDASGMATDATNLMTAGVALAAETFELGCDNFGWSPEVFDLYICHQVSASNTKKLCQALGLDENRLIKTFPAYGNMGPVAVPFTLDIAREKIIPPKSRLALMGIGSGLCCSLLEVAWP